MSRVSTHVLDTTTGAPAVGVPVRLERADGAEVGRGRTDADGRVRALGEDLSAGTYALVFDTAAHTGPDAFFPEVRVTFTLAAQRDVHVPLLLSPFAYSTYRGS